MFKYMIHLEQMNRIHSAARRNEEEKLPRSQMQKSQARDNRALTMLTLKRIKENEKKMSDIGQAELGCQQDVRAWGGAVYPTIDLWVWGIHSGCCPQGGGC